ncbi:hypothetical protein IWX48DRAFT_591600 [Phyllosticta citricarpa]
MVGLCATATSWLKATMDGGKTAGQQPGLKVIGIERSERKENGARRTRLPCFPSIPCAYMISPPPPPPPPPPLLPPVTLGTNAVGVPHATTDHGSSSAVEHHHHRRDPFSPATSRTRARAPTHVPGAPTAGAQRSAAQQGKKKKKKKKKKWRRVGSDGRRQADAQQRTRRTLHQDRSKGRAKIKKRRVVVVVVVVAVAPAGSYLPIEVPAKFLLMAAPHPFACNENPSAHRLQSLFGNAVARCLQGVRGEIPDSDGRLGFMQRFWRATRAVGSIIMVVVVVVPQAATGRRERGGRQGGQRTYRIAPGAAESGLDRGLKMRTGTCRSVARGAQWQF